MSIKPKIVALTATLITIHAFFAATQGAETLKTSILTEPWPGNYGGVPPWHRVRPDEFVKAFEHLILEAEAEVDGIADSDSTPTFENTFVPYELAGEQLSRLRAIFGVHAGNLNVGPMPDIQKIVNPKLAAHSDRITQNSKLFARIEAVYKSDAFEELSAEEQRLVEDRYKTFVRHGAKLNDEEKAKLSQINQRLASLFTDFMQNVLDDEQKYVTWIDNQDELAGLPDSVVSAMSNAAKERGGEAKWAVTNTRSSMDPFLTYADNRALREQVWRAYYNRGDNGDEHDNNAIISEILKLRARRAKLLGYETHAHWRLESSMAKTPEATMNLMMNVWPKAVARVREEVADMQRIADQELTGDQKIKIEPWDYRYYAEKVRKEKYDLDFNEVKPYLQLDKLVEAMLWCSTELFGLEYKLIGDIPVFHPDVKVWEVRRNGEHVGLFYLDPYAREGKRSGAWMTDYREQHKLGGKVTPLISNNSNFVKPADGEATLISWDDALTLFHEFGHALHGLLSDVKYPSQSGTSVARDYVEFPSQINEHWLSTDQVLDRFCVHYKTGQPMPKSLIEKIKKAETFNQGFGTVEFLSSALVDMKLHLAGDVEINPDAFEKKTLADLGMPSEIVMRHRTPHFAHVFASDGYSAGYYSYLWADALTADAAEAFEEAKDGFFDATTAKRLYEKVLSRGDTVDPAVGFREFRGRDVETKALLRKRGFPVN